MNGPPQSVNSASGRVQSVDRAVQLLNAVAEGGTPRPRRLLADRCGLNRSTTWRLLATLERHGLVERDPETNRYSVGLAVAQLAGASRYDALARRAHPLLRRLADDTGETVNLAIPHQHELVYVSQVQAPHVMTANWLAAPWPFMPRPRARRFSPGCRPRSARSRSGSRWSPIPTRR